MAPSFPSASRAIIGDAERRRYTEAPSCHGPVRQHQNHECRHLRQHVEDMGVDDQSPSDWHAEPKRIDGTKEQCPRRRVGILNALFKLDAWHAGLTALCRGPKRPLVKDAEL